ncbi:acyl-CoA dehydrogenase family protein [Lentzea sp. NBRC 102530]|uniref:acyl-CoA dehydrogenase family protein n=1 Tax=Lentzea sp. NBRC 102530 TaxID=3032201 RepID=UPI0024A33F66|nr:acyl-CoA dehydrogenase family protein [Lentzea sp. NBRC 102530]GLY47470.1 acyl-CoA dehydrogenase [Lentzea sp. NBRC 102530]
MTPEQLALRDAVRGLLAKHSDVRAAVETPHGYDEDVWARLSGMGVLPIPEEFGGSGATAQDTCVVLEELGRTLTPSPLLATTIATHALLSVKHDELLRRIANGAIATLAWPWDGTQVTGGDHLTGTFRYVLDGDHAEILVVSDGEHLYEVREVTPEHTPAMDRTRRLATVHLDRAPATRLGPWDPAVRTAAIAALAAEQVGTAARALELTVEHTKTRVQFGRPIGSFQALKHRMADMHVLVETARSAAGAVVDETSATVAKVYCSEALFAVAAEMVQLHGGIAITWEHDAHLYFKRAHGSRQLFGSPQDHLKQLARSAHK